MPNLGNANAVEEYKKLVGEANHVLLIGASKTGKSDWLAQAAIDGFDILYVDKGENGLATLLARLEGNQAALSRVHYVSPLSITEFIIAMTKSPVVRYNERTRELYQMNKSKPDDEIVEIRPLRIARNRNVLVTFDSYTKIVSEIINDVADKKKIDLIDIEKFGRSIYGPSGFKATGICEALQICPFNFVLQAHPGIYEIKEKPANRVAEDIDEREMIIRDTWEIPLSTSNPHGLTVGKHFNQIGWMELIRGDKFQLSFKQKRLRVVGGTVATEGDPRTTHSYKNLFGKGLTLPVPIDPDLPWIRRMTSEQYQAESKAGQAPKPAASAPAPQMATTGAIKPAGGIKIGG